MKGDIVKEYLTEFPDTPKLTLAKMIYAENKEVFKDVENVRDIIRHHTGSAGKAKRNTLIDKSFIRQGVYNPFDSLPEGLTYFNEWEPYHITGKSILAIADTHIPYHHAPSLRIALQRGKDEEIDTILILGDFVDFYSVSFWEKDPRKRMFKEELQTVHQILDIIREQFPNVEIIYKIGNHEERYERYMKVKAPELLGVKEFELESLLKTDYYKLTMIGDKRIVKINHLNCIHGHEFGRAFTSPVNPARGLYLKGKEIALGAHHHQTSQHTEKSMTNDIISCWSLGGLCDLRPDYLPINKWNHGFAVISQGPGGFNLNNYKIINGKVYQ